MAITAQPVDSDMSAWAPITKHYRTSDGDNLAVESSSAATPADVEAVVGELLTVLDTDIRSTTIVIRPTLIFTCTEDGAPLDLTPRHVFPAGTSHVEALRLAGYEVAP